MTTLADAARRLADAGIENPRLEARVLLAHALGIPANTLINPPLEGRSKAAAGASLRFEQFLARRIAREPIAYIIGHREFWSLDFAVGPGVLIPRPDSETLIDQVLASFPDRAAALRILDLGTGSGCLLFAVLSEFPNAAGIGIDSSIEALTWAKANRARLQLAGRAELILGGWDAPIPATFDVILSNPPYIRSGDIAGLDADVRLYEPMAALDGGADGLDAYRALGPEIQRLLAPKGLAFLEIGADQGSDVPLILSGAGLNILAVAPDLAGHPRCVVAGPV